MGACRHGRGDGRHSVVVERSIRGAKTFSVERLDRGELPPPGTMEAMLVFSGESDAEEDVNLLSGSDSVRP